MNPNDHFSSKSTKRYQNMMLWNVNLRSNIAILGTLPETNTIPKEKRNYCNLPTIDFQGRTVCFREGMIVKLLGVWLHSPQSTRHPGWSLAVEVQVAEIPRMRKVMEVSSDIGPQPPIYTFTRRIKNACAYKFYMYIYIYIYIFIINTLKLR